MPLWFLWNGFFKRILKKEKKFSSKATWGTNEIMIEIKSCRVLKRGKEKGVWNETKSEKSNQKPEKNKTCYEIMKEIVKKRGGRRRKQKKKRLLRRKVFQCSQRKKSDGRHNKEHCE